MTKEEAIDLLIASACCTRANLSCADCPRNDENECKSAFDNIQEAVRVMKKERDENG